MGATGKHPADSITNRLDEFFWALRREGMRIATPQALDALRALTLLGLSERNTVHDALEAVLVTESSERATFERVFHELFDSEPKERPPSLPTRLLEQGLSEDEIRLVMGWVEGCRDSQIHRAWSATPSEVDHFISVLRRRREVQSLALRNPALAAHRGLSELGALELSNLASSLESYLEQAVGVARARELLRIVHADQRDFGNWFRKRLRSALAPNEERRAPVLRSRMLESDRIGLRAALRELSQSLLAAEARKRRHRRGRALDVHRTLRDSLSTLGVPLRLRRKKVRVRRPRLVLLCDLSDSVRSMSELFLEFAHLSHSLFEDARSFVFVSDLSDTTDLFRHRGADEAISEILSGRITPLERRTQYARPLHSLLRNHGSALGPRTLVLILGDGRCARKDAGVDELRVLASRVGRLVWLCPDPRETWGESDCQMPLLEPICESVRVASTPEQFIEAARRIATLKM